MTTKAKAKSKKDSERYFEFHKDGDYFVVREINPKTYRPYTDDTAPNYLNQILSEYTEDWENGDTLIIKGRIIVPKITVEFD